MLRPYPCGEEQYLDVRNSGLALRLVFASLDRKEKVGTVSEQRENACMCVFMNLVVVFAICSLLSFFTTAGELGKSERAVAPFGELFPGNEDPISSSPMWRSSQKGVTQRRPDSRQHLSVVLLVLAPTALAVEGKHVRSFSSSPLRATRRYQSFQVYRL